MDLRLFVNRLKGLVSEPRKEFVRINADGKIPKNIIIDFILPLVIINAVASFLGEILFGPASFTVGSGIVVKNVVFIALVQTVSVYLSAYLVNELMPLFQSQKDFNATFRLIAYSFTPIFVTTILAGLLPHFSNIINFMGFYSVVIIWIGCDELLPQMKDRKQFFVPVAILATGIIYLAIRGILGLLLSF